MKFNYDIEPLPEGFMEFFDKKITEQNQMKTGAVSLDEKQWHYEGNKTYRVGGNLSYDDKMEYKLSKVNADILNKYMTQAKSDAERTKVWVMFWSSNENGNKAVGPEKAIAYAKKAIVKEEVELSEGMTVAFDKNGKLVGLYRDLETAKKLKPNHTYKPYDKNKEYGVDTERELAKFEEEYQLPRQFKDPKTEMEIVKNDKVIVIDKKDWAKYKKDGWMLAEMYGDLPLKTKGADGFIAMYNGKKLEIKKSEVNSLYDAKKKAIEYFKVPKSKENLIAIAPAYNESADLTEGMSDDDIRDYYDSHPNLTLQQLAAKTGKSVAELKKILMNEGVDLTPDTEEEDDDEKKSLKTLELESKETKNMTSLVEAIRAVVTGKTLTEAEDKNPDFDKERKGKLDPVDPKQTDDDFEDREDKDIDNDGDSDSSDEYLHKRRAAIAKALDKKD